jgi:uncharacterized glyoxalase superfamily protein PhnB
MKTQIRISGSLKDNYKLVKLMSLYTDRSRDKGSYEPFGFVLNYKSRAAAISDIKAAYRQLKNEGAVISRDRTQLFYGDSKAVLININAKVDKLDAQGSITKQENL